ATTAEFQAAASTSGQQIEVFNVETTRDLDDAFGSFAKAGVEGLVVGPGALFLSRSAHLVTLATHYRLPTIYPFRENAEAGGLMSYGSSQAEQFRKVGVYTGRILKGEKPADLPVMRATRFEFIINLHTAKLLGIQAPATLLAIADEVI